MRVRRTMTRDGVEIAYVVTGEGPPVIYRSGIVSHLRKFTPSPAGGSIRWLYRILEGFSFVTFDMRGMGASQRDLDFYPEDADYLDMLAVIEALGDAPVAIVALLAGGPAAIRVAAAHPERVRALVLSNTSARADPTRSPMLRDLDPLARSDWTAFSDALAQMLFPAVPRGDKLSQVGDVIRGAMNQGDWIARREQMPPGDVSDLLARVRAPTLVLHSEEARYPPLHEARATAEGIPGAEFALLPGGPGGDWPDAVVERVRAHLRGREPARTGPGLSPREWEVARLLVAGGSNAEIAAELGLSASTVGHSLTRIYRKLGVRRRAEAVSALHRLEG